MNPNELPQEIQDAFAPIEIRYKLAHKSFKPSEKLAELHELCVKWGTVTNTLINGLTPQGELLIEKTG